MENDLEYKLSKNFSIKVVLESPNHETILPQVNSIWREELIQREGKLFNGSLLIYKDFDGDTLKGYFSTYKFYIASLKNPSLVDCKPITISCYTETQDSVLLGKRSSFVTTYQNYYELVPAGGIEIEAIDGDTINLKKQILKELLEETLIPSEKILSISPEYLIFCSKENLYEIICLVRLDNSLIDLQPTEEYSELLWIPKNQLRSFVKKNEKQIIPVSLKICDLFN